jgi:replication factor C small subunit
LTPFVCAAKALPWAKASAPIPIDRNSFEYFGATVGNKSKTTRIVPSWANNKLFFKGYMQGLYDSDGNKFVIEKNNMTVRSIKLRQSIYEMSQSSFMEQIKYYLKTHFDINTDIITGIDTHTGTFGGSMITTCVQGCKQDDIMKYIECVGHYYDKTTRPEILGFLKYKNAGNHRHIMKFTEWMEKYYGFGHINDEILSIEKLSGDYDVYDCSFDNHHWYITNGFVSHNCNYPHKIIPALHSRTQGFHIDDLDRGQFAERTATILIKEGIDLTEENLEILDEYITVTYPDLRKCINLLQQNCTDRELKRPSARSGKGSADYMVSAVSLFKAGKIHDARKIICANATSEEYEDIYKLLYRNIEWWGETEDQQNRAIVIIANRLKDHALVADPEIAMAACLIELSMVGSD